MAKRSDFAQKLLDDLRLRKERLAGAQSSGGPQTAKARDSYGYSKQTFRGSTNHGKQAAVRTENTNRRSNGANRSLLREESSSQLIPFGRGQGSQQIGDLSMALALALENGGKIRRVDSSGRSSVLTFLPQMGRTGQGNRGRIPDLSHLHIQEISKGAQKLNQILRACSNGLNFDQYSVEIGKELLKGAVDLQQSLQMLVNLQSASEVMVRPQRKSRIVLLGDDNEVAEDEDDDKSGKGMIEQKQLDLLPRFSFDKQTRPRHPQKQQRLPALGYGNEARAPSTILEEKKYVSSSSSGKVVKGRMSNVIAKLMGLEQVPGNIDSEKSRTKNTEPKTKENVGPVVTSIKHDRISPVAAKSAIDSVQQAEKIPASRTVSNVALKFQEKPPWKNPEGVKAMMAMDRRFITQQMKKQQEQYGVVDKQNGRATGKTEPRLTLEEKVEPKERKARTEKRNQDGVGADVRSRQVYVPPSMKTPNKKQPETDKRMAKQKKGNEPISRPPSQRECPVTNHLKLKKYLPDQAVHLQPWDEVPRSQKDTRGGKFTEHDNVKIADNNSTKKTTRRALQDVPKPMAHRSPSREAKQWNNGEAYVVTPTKIETTKEVGSNAAKVLKREDEVVTPSNNLNSEEPRRMKKMSSVAPEDSGRNEVLSPVSNNRHIPARSGVGEEVGSAKVIPNTSNGQFNLVLSNLNDDGQTTPINSAGTITNTGDQPDKEIVPIPEIQEPLTESETRLKRILVKSRTFLNTAEALFKLNIPIGVLNTSGHDVSHEGGDNKLELDCAFEILKRNGRRVELAVHPFTRKAWIGKFPNFDDVVRQLFRSFEGLRSHGRKGRQDCELEDYLPQMLELDIHARDPETDCMWDLGWNVLTFAVLEKDEIAKDVEKLMISSLIDDMARDLIHT